MPTNIKQILANKSNDYSELETKFFEATKKSLIFDTCSLAETEYFKLLSASIVIPAWNVKGTILICLTAIEQSSFNQKYPGKLQVVITDDGSTDNTLKILKESNLKLNLTVVHQENHGQGLAMNAGISAAEGDIIIEVDADTILNYYAIENLMARHQFHKNALYTGFRHYVNSDDDRVKLKYIKKNGPDPKPYILNDERIKFPEPGWPDNMCIASNHYKDLGNSRGLWMGNDDNNDPWILADMVFGMLFSMPRDIFNKIGGFDDRFEGWGCDDGYVGAKAISEGVFVIPVYTATGFHISHPFRTEDKQSEYDFNRKFFFDFINATDYLGHPDWIAKAAKRIDARYIISNSQKSSKFSKLSNKAIEPMNIEDLIAVGQFSEAYDLIIKLEDKNDQYYLYLGRTLLGLRRYQESVNILQEACRYTKSPDLLLLLARANASIHKYTEAHSILEEISKNNPEYPELKYWLIRDPAANLRQGINFYNQKSYDVAKVCFEAVLISDHNNIEAAEYHSKCLNEIENLTKSN